MAVLLRSQTVSYTHLDVYKRQDQALYKLPEEVSELTKAMAEGSHAHIDEELGDVFFAAVNVARLLKRDPEQLLNAATDKFIRCV